MRQHWLTAIVLLGLFAGSVAPARAESVDVDPQDTPEATLDPSEMAKLTTLQSSAFTGLTSDISPDDATIMLATRRTDDTQLGFVDVASGAVTPIDAAATQLQPLSEVRWADAHTAVYVAFDQDVGPVLAAIDRDSGQVVSTTVELPGSPLTLSPDASRLLIAVTLDDASDSGLHHSPFRLPVRSTLDQVGPTRFDATRQELKLSEEVVNIAILDLRTGEQTTLETLPSGSGIVSAAWSQDGAKLALVRTTIPDISRKGNLLSEKATQDALGNLAPADNPFFQGNVVDAFDLNQSDFRPGLLKANAGNGDTFGRVSWSTDGQKLLTQMQRPSKLAGRKYPTYLFADRAYLRFYNNDGQLLNTFDRPELAAPNTAMPMFVSPDEVIVNAPVGLSYHLFYYNRVSGEFRQITREAGTYYQVRSTRLSRQLVFNYSSFQKPYEVYHIGWDGSGLAALTNANAEIAATNKIRADQMTFTLRGGVKRTGYLLQPADAAFPPRNARIVVWQQGGPGGTMTDEWGGNVEQPFNLLPNFGIAVLVLPLPGREGFGAGFYNGLAENRNYGSIDIDEQAQAVEQMIAKGYTAHNKVGITGCSYGGYFTSQSITRYPNLYAAANTQCTLLDLYAEWQFGFTPFITYLEGRVPTADRTEYGNDSPVYNAVKVRTPLLIFDGTDDFLPISISGNFHDQVAANGTPVKFLRFKDEGHGLRAPNSQLVAGQAQLNWFRQYLAASGSR